MKKSVCLFIVFCFFLQTIVFPQGNNASRKALDAFISATTKSAVVGEPVPDAEIVVELLPGRKGMCMTRNDGVFGIDFSKIDEVQGKESKTINLRLTVKTRSNFPLKATDNVIQLTLPKSEGPYYEFTLKFERDDPAATTGRFVVERREKAAAPPKGGKQGKGSAVKTGDSYQGEVMHF